MRLLSIVIGISAVALGGATVVKKPAAAAAPPLRLEKTIVLPGLEGRLGAIAVDAGAQRLFLVAPVSDAVAVVDLRSGKGIRTIGGFRRPQGLAYHPATNRLFVSTRGDSKVVIIDARSYAVVQSVPVSGGDPDAVHLSPSDNRVLVSYNAGVLVCDVNGKQLNDLRTDSVPEDFVVETAGPRVWINLPLVKAVAVAGRTDRSVARTWPVSSSSSTGVNHAIAVDERGHQLFVGTRRPSNLLVLSADAGFRIDGRQTVNEPETISYDAANRRLYITGNDSVIDVVRQAGADRYEPLARVPASAGGRTSLLVPELSRFFVAAGKTGAQPATIQVFQVNP